MRSERQAFQIRQRLFRLPFLLFGSFLSRLLLLRQSVVLFVYHFDLVLVVGNLRRWTPITLSIDTFLPSSKDTLNVMASLLNSAIIKPFSLRKVFPLVVVIESIILNVCWWFIMLPYLALPVLYLVVSHLSVIVVELDALVLCHTVRRAVL